MLVTFSGVAPGLLIVTTCAALVVPTFCAAKVKLSGVSPITRQAYELSSNLSREERLVAEGRYRAIDHEHEKSIEIYRTLFTLFPDNLDYGLKLAEEQSRGGKGHDALATIELLRKLGPRASEDPRIELEEATAWRGQAGLKHEEQPLARAGGEGEGSGIPADPRTSTRGPVCIVQLFRTSTECGRGRPRIQGHSRGRRGPEGRSPIAARLGRCHN
jgi:hypothetical protein